MMMQGRDQEVEEGPTAPFEGNHLLEEGEETDEEEEVKEERVEEEEEKEEEDEQGRAGTGYQ